MARHWTRRELLRAAGLGVLAGAMPPRLAAAAGAKRRPNVLFIAVDDLNDWIGCLGGHPDARTPHIDALARRGMLFTNAHCAAPLCNPSRAALMTGIRPSTSGVYANNQPWRRALKDAVTIPQHFRAHGYRAIGSGKIYHGAFPDPPSWDDYWPSQTQNRPADPTPPNAPLNGIPNTAHFDWGPIDVRDEDMGDWKVADWVREQLARRPEQPMFLACGIFRPHLPWYVPRKYFQMFPPEKVTLPQVRDDDLDDVPEIARRIARPQGDHAKVLRTNNWRKAVSGYLASMAFADTCIGRVLEALDNGPWPKDTIIVLWGDHGWHLGEKLHWRKFTLWEEATRCPLIIVAPGITPPGSRCHRPVNLLDIYPTLIELCGLKPNSRLEGRSLVPLLKDPSAKWDPPSLCTFRRGNHSLRDERWRYTRYVDGTEELYDHQRDPMEWTNLAAEDQYDDVKKRLGRWLPKTNAPDAPAGRRNKGKPARKRPAARAGKKTPPA